LKVEIWALILAIAASVIGSFAALFMKLAVINADAEFKTYLKNPKLYFGLFCYVCAIFIFFLALKGGELSTLTPIDSLSYIWITILSYIFLGERISKWKKIGILLIIIGVIIVNINIKLY